MDDVIKPYVARSPRRHWIKYFLICSLVVWIAAVVGLGVPTIKRATWVSHTATVALHINSGNALWLMVAGQRPVDHHSELGQLATKVLALRSQPAGEEALRTAGVYPARYPDVSGQLGYDVFTTSNSIGQAGFSDLFVLNALEATPEQVKYLHHSPSPVSSYGNWTWQNLVYGTVAYWLLAGLVVLALRFDRRRWNARAAREFEESLTPVARDALAVMRDIKAHPNLANYNKLWREAEELFGQVRHGYGDPQIDVARDVTIRLASLKQEFASGQQAYEA